MDRNTDVCLASADIPENTGQIRKFPSTRKHGQTWFAIPQDKRKACDDILLRTHIKTDFLWLRDPFKELAVFQQRPETRMFTKPLSEHEIYIYRMSHLFVELS